MSAVHSLAMEGRATGRRGEPTPTGGHDNSAYRPDMPGSSMGPTGVPENSAGRPPSYDSLVGTLGSNYAPGPIATESDPSNGPTGLLYNSAGRPPSYDSVEGQLSNNSAPGPTAMESDPPTLPDSSVASAEDPTNFDSQPLPFILPADPPHDDEVKLIDA